MTRPSTEPPLAHREDELSRDDLLVLHERMKEALAAELGDPEYEPLTMTLRERDGTLVGGLVGYTFWGWLGFNVFWVLDRYRRKGFGAQLLRSAEREAIARGCCGAHTDTYSPEAVSFAVRNGYELVQTIESAGAKARRYSLVKLFVKLGSELEK